MDRVNKDYYLPSIQREFVWDEEKIEKLFDSLMQEYPIGNILVWQFNKEINEDKVKFEVYKFIDKYDEDNPHNEEANLNGISNLNLILDGQQRLTSLFIGLRGSYSYTYYTKKKTLLYVDLFSDIENDVDNTYGMKYDFQFLEKDDLNDEGEHWFEVGKVLNYREKTAEDLKEDFDEEIRKKAKDNSDLIKKAKNVLGQLHKVICGDSERLNITQVSTSDEEKILNIFVRTNDGGMKLEKADLLLSYMEANRDLFQPKGARKEILAFVDELNEEKQNKPPYKFYKDDVLKASLVLSDLSVQYKLKNFNKENLKKIDDNWINIKKYLDLTVKLIAKYGFNEKNIVSKNALIPIAYYFMKKGLNETFLDSEINKDIDLKNNIINWLTVSSLKRAFGSSSDSTLERMRKGISEEKELYELIGGQEITKEIIENWVRKEKYNSRYSHLLLMLITEKKYWGDNIHQDHIFPESKFDNEKYLESLGLSKNEVKLFRENKDSIANLQLLKSTINIKKTDDDFVDWKAEQNKEFLKGILIPEDISYEFKDFLNFIDKREELIIQKLMNILGVKED